ncbi:hypothetical protein ACLK1Z_13555 [Escherichia coli]
MVNFEALRPLAAEEARDAFAQGEDIVLCEENEFPTQVGVASGRSHLSVGCDRMTTVCRSKSSSGRWPITFALAAR